VCEPKQVSHDRDDEHDGEQVGQISAEPPRDRLERTQGEIGQLPGRVGGLGKQAQHERQVDEDQRYRESQLPYFEPRHQTVEQAQVAYDLELANRFPFASRVSQELQPSVQPGHASTHDREQEQQAESREAGNQDVATQEPCALALGRAGEGVGNAFRQGLGERGPRLAGRLGIGIDQPVQDSALDQKVAVVGGVGHRDGPGLHPPPEHCLELAGEQIGPGPGRERLEPCAYEEERVTQQDYGRGHGVGTKGGPRVSHRAPADLGGQRGCDPEADQDEGQADGRAPRRGSGVWRNSRLRTQHRIPGVSGLLIDRLG